MNDLQILKLNSLVNREGAFEMSSKVRLIDDPVLRIKCEPVVLNSTLDLNTLLNEMHGAMQAEQGLGLAANQIGHSVRVFILKADKGFKEFINPEIVIATDLMDFDDEGCLSIPGTSAKTKRFKRVTLRWTDISGSSKEEEFVDMEAFAVQHEMDHLNGKLYIDQLGPLKRELVVKKHKKFLKLRS